MVSQIINAIIIDDEPDACESLEQHLKEYPIINVISKELDSQRSIVTIIKEKPDLIFLDVNMPGKSGIELAREIIKLGLEPKIIFVTAFDKYAIEAFKVEAFDYILKPVDKILLKETLERFFKGKKEANLATKIENLQQNIAGKRLRINVEGGFIMVDPDQIFYISADGSYSNIYYVGGRKQLVSKGLGALQDQLNEHQFIRIHKSYLVNDKHILSFDRRSHTLTIYDSEQKIDLKVSRRYRKNLN